MTQCINRLNSITGHQKFDEPTKRQYTPRDFYPSPRRRCAKSHNRGLYEQDKLSFKLILALKILLTARRLEQADVTLFIKGGAALDLNSVRPKPYLWLADPAWLNAIQLSRENALFKVRYHRWGHSLTRHYLYRSY